MSSAGAVAPCRPGLRGLGHPPALAGNTAPPSQARIWAGRMPRQELDLSNLEPAGPAARAFHLLPA